MTLLTVPAASPATPLISLTAVSFDTEATSLDVKSGRILEFGAIALINGALNQDHIYSSYVNPQIAIPANSSRIHGITAEKVAAAPGFADVNRAFRLFAGNHLILGFAVDFDLAILRAEHERAGLAWKPPAALDVRSLVRILRPALPDFALETIAQWQGIAVENRHQALGDAVLTARVFLSLVPLLRERNIRTLGEALAASAALDTQASNMPTLSPPPGLLSALARTDSFPYRHRIKAVMAVPPLHIAATETLATAMNMMVESRVSSLFVTAVDQTTGHGILTERDVLRTLSTHQQKGFSLPVAKVASKPLKTVREDDFIYVAMGIMRREKIRHLGVVDQEGRLVGAVSQRDLLRLRADEALALTGALSDAASVTELAGVWRKLAEAARALLAEDVEAREVAAIVSGEVCKLTARAAVMAEAEIESERPNGLSYAVMVLGSGGRGESLLALDQDNAIVFTCEDEAAAEAWLARLATRMNAILDIVGVPFCKGGVMASNAKWRKTSAAWRRQVETWLSRTNPGDIMNADIFFDSLAVHGEVALVDDLRHSAIAAASASPAFLKLMSLSATAADPAFSWFGRFAVDETGRLDLKRLGIMPIFTAARVAALRFHVHERSTKARLMALRGNSNVPQRTLESLVEAHGLLLNNILGQQLDDLDHGRPLSNSVDPKALSTLEQERLKWALLQVKSVNDLLDVPAV